MLVDCFLYYPFDLIDINGGSFRVYIRKNKSNDRNFKTAPYRDVANYRIQSLLTHEEKDGITTTKPYLEFYERIKALRDETVSFIKDQKSKGKTIWAYGASTKGNIILNYSNITSNLMPCVAEVNSFKYNKLIPGSKIKIISELKARKLNPNYFLVLPWHFKNFICKKEKKIYGKLSNRPKLIFPLPNLNIV